MNDQINPNPAYIPESKHSAFGIASFLVSFFGLLGSCLFVVGVLVLAFRANRTADRPFTVAVGALILCTMVPCVIGVILGLIGLFERNRKRGFPVLGLCLNALVLAAIIFLLVWAKFRADNPSNFYQGWELKPLLFANHLELFLKNKIG